MSRTIYYNYLIGHLIPQIYQREIRECKSTKVFQPFWNQSLQILSNRIGRAYCMFKYVSGKNLFHSFGLLDEKSMISTRHRPNSSRISRSDAFVSKLLR